MENISTRREARVGDLRQVKVTLPEAAQVLQLDVAQVRKAIDRRVVTPMYILHGKRRIRALDGVDVLCLRMQTSLKSSIRGQLYGQLKRAPEQESLKKFFDISVVRKEGHSEALPLGWVFGIATETLADIASVKDCSRLVDDEGKIRGSEVEAHRVAALIAGGMSVDEVLDDYPNLTRVQIEAAVRYARTKPKQGRPYPSRSVKSVLRNGGGGGLAAAFALARDDDDSEAEDER
jgi:hypothetical protein